jgi:tetratricopeptide (TPR) repeat protein
VKRYVEPVGVAALVSGLALGIGCTSNERATSNSESRAAMRPVSIPDLSRASEPVQAQLRERYVSLTAKIEESATPTIALAHEYGEMGKLFMAAEYRDAAEPCFLNAQTLTPAEGHWPYYLAHVYRLKGDLSNAALSFERAIHLRPDDVAALVWLGEVYLRQGQPEPAEPLFTKALSLQRDLASALFGLGRVALAKRDYAGAVRHLEAALAHDQLASGIHYPLAMAYRGLGAMDKAETHLRQRGQIDPAPPDPLLAAVNESLHSAMGYERLGIKALDRNDWATAAAYFRQGVEVAPDSATVRHRLGTALFLNGDVQGAMAQFEEVVRRSPDFAKARYSLGVLLMTVGRENDALEQLSAAVKYDPNDVEARLRLAEVLRRSGRAQAALSEYEQVLRIDTRGAEARFGLAIALVRLGRYAEARDRLREGTQLYPGQPAFARALARLLASAPDARVRDGRQALALTQQLLKQRQTLDLGETMAMTLAELGQYEQAAAFQREVMAAIQKGGHQDVVQQLARNLERYERREPSRTPLRTDDPVEAFEPAPQ